MHTSRWPKPFSPARIRVSGYGTGRRRPRHRMRGSQPISSARPGAPAAGAAASPRLRCCAAPVELTPDYQHRAERQLALADAELMSGHPDTARNLIDDATPRLTDDILRAKAKRLSGDTPFAEGKSTQAAGVLAAASRPLVPNTSGMRNVILQMRCGLASGPGRTRYAPSRARRGQCPPPQDLHWRSATCWWMGSRPGSRSATPRPSRRSRSHCRSASRRPRSRDEVPVLRARRQRCQQPVGRPGLP